EARCAGAGKFLVQNDLLGKGKPRTAPFHRPMRRDVAAVAHGAEPGFLEVHVFLFGGAQHALLPVLRQMVPQPVANLVAEGRECFELFDHASLSLMSFNARTSAASASR